MRTTLPLLFALLGSAASAAEPAFHFVETKGEYIDLKFGDRRVLRFVNKPHDGTTPESHYLTFKPFHQVFDPKTGEVNLTSGAHPNTKEFLYPHHRGLFFGFNNISYGNKKADIWHGHDNVYSTVDKIVAQQAGESSATQTAAISWHGKDGQPFAEEVRTVYVANGKDPAGTKIDWSTTLSTKLPKVRLDGDPQHAGFHFRANQEVSKTGKANTYYLRPDGKGKVGETRNWVAKSENPKELVKDPRTINLPWNACSFVVAGERYTVLRINHPDNPKETRGSEREYARFGDYFEYDLTPEKPLKLKYRVWVQAGEMTGEQCEAMAKAFVTAEK